MIQKLIWIDENSQNNTKYIEEVEKNFTSLKTSNFSNVKDGINELKKINFGYCYVIISGQLYPQYVQEIKSEVKNLKCFPIVFIFTSKEMKKIYTETHDDPNIPEEIYQTINTHFYNYGGVHSIFNGILKFMKNFEKSIKLNYKDSKVNKKLDYSDCFIFKKIKKGEELIIHSMFSHLISNKDLSNDELSKFNNLLIKNHYNEKVGKLLMPLQFLSSDMPIEILSKFYSRIYTSDSTFYKELNNNLMKNDDIDNNNDYSIFIKIMFKALEKEVFITNVNCFLYRASQINEKEYNILIECLNEKQENLPGSILYCKAFLSFTKDEKRAINFLKPSNSKEFIPVIFQIKKSPQNLNNNLASCADLDAGNLSFFKKEKEVLFFPFSTFTVEDIEEKVISNEKHKNIKAKIITLDYLGKYQDEINNATKKLNIKEYFNNLKKDDFLKEIKKAGLLTNKNDNKGDNKKEGEDEEDEDEFNDIERELEEEFQQKQNILNHEYQEKVEKIISNICILKNKNFCYSQESGIILVYNEKYEKIITIQDKNSKEPINFLYELHNGKILTLSFDNAIRIITINYDDNSYEISEPFNEHKYLITKSIQTNNNLIYTCSLDGTIRLWKDDKDKEIKYENCLVKQKKYLFYSLINFKDIYLIALLDMNDQKYIFKYNLKSKKDDKKQIDELELKTFNLFNLDNNLICAGGNQKIFLFNDKLEVNLILDLKKEFKISSIFQFKDKTFVFGSDKGGILIIDKLDKDFSILFEQEQFHKREINSFGEFADGNVISRSRDKLKIWGKK